MVSVHAGKSLSRTVISVAHPCPTACLHDEFVLSVRACASVVRSVPWQLKLVQQSPRQMQKLYSTLARDTEIHSRVTAIRIDSTQAAGTNDALLRVPRGRAERTMFVQQLEAMLYVEFAGPTLEQIDRLNSLILEFLESVHTIGSVHAMLAWIIIGATSMRRLDLQAHHQYGRLTVLTLLGLYADYLHVCNHEAFPCLKIMHIRPHDRDSALAIYRGIEELQVVGNHAAFDLTTSYFRPQESTLIQKLCYDGFLTAFRTITDFITQGRAEFCQELEVKHSCFNLDDIPVTALVEAIVGSCGELRKLCIEADYQSSEDNADIVPLLPTVFHVATFNNLTHFSIDCDHIMGRLSDPSGTCRKAENLLSTFLLYLPTSVEHAHLGGWLVEDVKVLAETPTAQNAVLQCHTDRPRLHSLRLSVDVEAPRGSNVQAHLQPFQGEMTHVVHLAFRQHVKLGWYVRRIGDNEAMDKYYLGYYTEAISRLDRLGKLGNIRGGEAEPYKAETALEVARLASWHVVFSI